MKFVYSEFIGKSVEVTKCDPGSPENPKKEPNVVVAGPPGLGRVRPLVDKNGKSYTIKEVNGSNLACVGSALSSGPDAREYVHHSDH